MRNWRSPALLAAGGVLGAAALFAGGSPVFAVILLLWFLGWAWASTPLLVRSSVTAAEAQARSAEDGRPIVYWRPGCPFCLRMRLGLLPVGRRVHWVNIWSDPEGAAAVRAVADGNETVPTVIAAGAAHVNPAPSAVRGWARSGA
ncbi:glutaredoxin domain-containing protein [Cryptosporangium minutisporangium]|uniref:Glutaredoxin domain-containing protein n=1 Tax=Cryptosporangium minutisporangium TaxID=113569 RepID=A0ABP6T153_9ACTN